MRPWKSLQSDHRLQSSEEHAGIKAVELPRKAAEKLPKKGLNIKRCTFWFQNHISLSSFKKRGSFCYFAAGKTWKFLFKSGNFKLKSVGFLILCDYLT